MPKDQITEDLDAVTKLTSQGRCDEALKKLNNIRSKMEDNQRVNHPNVALVTGAMAVVFWMLGDHKKASDQYAQALEILETQLESDDLRLANLLEIGGRFYREYGDLDYAETLLKQSISIYELNFGQNDPTVVDSLALMADVCIAQSRYQEARQLLLRARHILGSREDTDPALTVDILSSLARVFEGEGDYDTAESLLRQSLESQQENIDLATQADLETRQAFLLQEKGNFIDAESLLVKVKNTLKDEYGDDSIHLVNVLYSLGSLYVARQEYDLAEYPFWEALRIAEGHYGERHPNTALYYNAIGTLYLEEGNLDLAEKSFGQALELWTKSKGSKGSDEAAALENLGMVFHERGDYVHAEDYIKRAMVVYRNIRDDHPGVGRLVFRLGHLSLEKGDEGEALQHFNIGLGIQESSLGRGHPSLVPNLYQLAMVQVRQGNIEEAVLYLSRANDIIDQDLDANMVAGLNTDRSDFLDQYLGLTNRTLALHFHSGLFNEKAAHLAFRTLLRRKGRLMDANTDNLRWLLNSDDPKIRELAELHEIYVALRVDAYLNGAAFVKDWMDALDYHSNQFAEFVEYLEDEIRDIEREISLKAATQRGFLGSITIENICMKIPNQSVLIEFAWYFPIEPGEIDPLPPARYGAYVLRSDGTLAWADLGECIEIDKAIDDFRMSIQSPGRSDWKDPARVLDQRVIEPLRSHLGDSRHLLLSPDGSLTMVPFEVFIDSAGHHLVETYRVTYLTSGRDLLRNHYDGEARDPPIVLAGPDYDAVLDEEEPLADQEIGGVSKSELTEFTSLLPFTTLSGAEAEGRILRSILPGTNVFIGAAASKTQLQSSHGPLVMHLATHGFFLEGSQLSDLVAIAKSDPTMHGRRHLLLPLRNETKLPRSLWDPNIKNPLIRSGLALAGVNHAQFGIRGVMTALEVSELDLWGTQLVVLSACDTGLGAVIFGQGVYGLRRAFLLAGAETLVMSLWKVSDAVTRDFMEGFYRRLRDGSGRSDALRSMQLELLRGNEYSHPFYWAAFILTGEWAPIKGW